MNVCLFKSGIKYARMQVVRNLATARWSDSYPYVNCAIVRYVQFCIVIYAYIAVVLLNFVPEKKPIIFKDISLLLSFIKFLFDYLVSKNMILQIPTKCTR